MLNVSVASFLAYKLNKRTCIIDTVGGFRNIAHHRIDEVEELKNNPDNEIKDFLPPCEYQNLLINPLLGSKVHIYSIDIFENFLDFLKEHMNDYDYVFLDLKGISKENFHFIMKSHYIFLVTSLEDIKKDKRTYNAFNFVARKRELNFNLQKVFLVLNQIPKDEEVEDKLGFLLKQKDLNVIEHIIYQRKTFSEYSTVIGLVEVSDEIKSFSNFITELIQEEVAI